MKKIIRLSLLVSLLSIFLFQTEAYAQRKKAYIPDDSPEGAMQKEEKVKKEKVKKANEKPLTKREGYKFMRRRDKGLEKNYETHHERIQQEKTYDRMKKNKKQAKYYNSRKRPNVIQRMLLKSRKR